MVDCMQALRVLHVAPYGGDAWAYGGIPRLSDAIVHGLAARGHHVVLCTTDACDASRRISLPYAGRDGAAQGRGAGGDVEVQVFPNVSNSLAYHQQCFLPIGLSRY